MELGSIERRPPPERMGGITKIFAGGGARLEFMRGALTGAPPVTDGTIVQTDEAAHKQARKTRKMCRCKSGSSTITKGLQLRN